MISHRNATAMMEGMRVCFDENQVFFKQGDRHLSYLPLPHVMERIGFLTNVWNGLENYYFSGDMLKIMDDVKDVKPAMFLSVPRIYTRLYNGI